MTGPLPPWRQLDNFRAGPHQRLVDGINELQSVTPGMQGGQVLRTPIGSGIYNEEEESRQLICRMKATTLLSTTSYPYLVKAKVWDGTNTIGEEVVVRSHRFIWAVDDELLATTPLGGVTTIDGTNVVDDSGNPVIWEQVNPTLDFFRVKVRKDGGDTGSLSMTEDCTFTYTLYDLDGNAITGATGLTPDVPRFPSCTYTAAADDTFGVAYVDSTGVIKLLWAVDEHVTTATIDVPTSFIVDDGSNKLQWKLTPALVLDKGDEGAAVDLYTGSVCS